MKNKLVLLPLLAIAGTAQAQVVLIDEAFGSAPSIQDLGSVGNDYAGSDATGGSPANTFTVTDGGWVVSGLGLTASHDGTNSELDATHANNANARARSMGVFVSLDALIGDSDTFTYSFDVSNFVGGSAGDSVTFEIYEVRDLGAADDNYLRLSLGDNSDLAALDTFFTQVNADDSFSGADANPVLSGISSVGVTGNGTIGGSFDVSNGYAGVENSYLFLSWTSSSAAGGLTNPSFSLDNLNVSSVPEPSVFALLSGMVALGSVMIRRRR